jgi:hypothetical protein
VPFSRFYFPTSYSWPYFQYLLHQFAFISFQLNLNLIIKLNLVELEFNSIQFKFQYFHSNGM